MSRSFTLPTLPSWLVLALAVGCLASIATPSLADETAAAPVRAEAIAKYKQGSQAYAEHRYKDAIDLFLDADALVGGNAALAYNTAMAYDAMGDGSSALRWAREYLRRAPDASDRPAVQRLVDGLEARLQAKGVQQLTVLSQPAGAVVAVDQKRLGVTPWTGELPPGAHVVSLTLERHATVERSFDLSASDALELQVSLPRVEDRDHSSGNRALVIGGATGLGAAAASFGIAIALEVARNGEEDKAKATPLQVDSMRHLENMEDLQLGSRVAAGVGGALLTAGATMLIVGLASDSEPAEQPVSAGCGADGCGLMLRGFF